MHEKKTKLFFRQQYYVILLLSEPLHINLFYKTNPRGIQAMTVT